MDQTQTRSGPNLGLLLLIPAVVIVAKAASRRAMEQRWDASDGRFGPRGRWGSAAEMGPRGFRLPPRIEAALDDWHARSHEAADLGASEDPGAPAA